MKRKSKSTKSRTPTKPAIAKHPRKMTTAELNAVSEAMKAKSEKTAKKAAGKKPQFSADQLKEIRRTENRAKAEIARKEFEASVLAAFASHGYKNVKPRITVKTAKLWIDAGFKPKAGERPVICPAPWSPPGGGYALFHQSQMEKA